MLIANPLYDTAFKELIRDPEVARAIIETLTGNKVHKIISEELPQTLSHKIRSSSETTANHLNLHKNTVRQCRLVGSDDLLTSSSESTKIKIRETEHNKPQADEDKRPKFFRMDYSVEIENERGELHSVLVEMQKRAVRSIF
ncbi:hypothetical protein AGMMS49938_09480 [Fibrobacterales bacterium]|nr:hypothetical protein AGMMS49938_09480 [Fibrobacterales bacterium]